MIDTVLFDLDGTIIDTNELIISSFQHVMGDGNIQLHGHGNRSFRIWVAHWSSKCVPSLVRRKSPST